MKKISFLFFFFFVFLFLVSCGGGSKTTSQVPSSESPKNSTTKTTTSSTSNTLYCTITLDSNYTNGGVTTKSVEKNSEYTLPNNLFTCLCRFRLSRIVLLS